MFCRHTRSSERVRKLAKNTHNKFRCQLKRHSLLLYVLSSLPPTTNRQSTTNKRTNAFQATSKYKAYNSQQFLASLCWCLSSQTLHFVVVVYFVRLLNFCWCLATLIDSTSRVYAFAALIPACALNSCVFFNCWLYARMRTIRRVRWKWKQKTEILWSRYLRIVTCEWEGDGNFQLSWV